MTCETITGAGPFLMASLCRAIFSPRIFLPRLLFLVKRAHELGVGKSNDEHNLNEMEKSKPLLSASTSS